MSVSGLQRQKRPHRAPMSPARLYASYQRASNIREPIEGVSSESHPQVVNLSILRAPGDQRNFREFGSLNKINWVF